jgi:hypothetical protein
MISDKERREVAAQLRNQLTYMRENGEYYKNDLDVVECGNSAYRNIADSVEKCSNNFTGYYITIVERLADLIDRPVYRPVIPNAMEGYVFCPQCGAEIGEYGVPNYCHSCGVAIHNG